MVAVKKSVNKRSVRSKPISLEPLEGDKDTYIELHVVERIYVLKVRYNKLMDLEPLFSFLWSLAKKTKSTQETLQNFQDNIHELLKVAEISYYVKPYDYPFKDQVLLAELYGFEMLKDVPTRGFLMNLVSMEHGCQYKNTCEIKTEFCNIEEDKPLEEFFLVDDINSIYSCQLDREKFQPVLAFADEHKTVYDEWDTPMTENGPKYFANIRL